MALGYSFQTQYPLPLIGTKTSAGVVTGTLLTSAYGGAGNSAVFDTATMSKVNFGFKWTLGSTETNNILHIKISTSGDTKNWYQQLNNSVAAGVSTITQAEYQFTGASTVGGPYSFYLPLDVADRHMKIEVYESAVNANYGNLYCEVILSGTTK